MKKNKRIYFFLGLIRSMFPVVEKAFPGLAQRWANELFFTPFRFPPHPKELDIINSARKFTFMYKKIEVTSYEWGSGPSILLMHGWAGRAGQFGEIVKGLVASGFKVVAFDAPAHGFTQGKKTHILDFKESILLINREKGSFWGVIGHSLGGAALLFAIKNGLVTQKVVTLSVPSVGDKIIEEFLSKIKASEKIKFSLKRFILKKFNIEFDDFSARNILSNDFPRTDFFIIHDKDDREAPLYHFEEIMKRVPYAKSMVTEGLGHNKILRDKKVISEIVKFLNSSPDSKITEIEDVQQSDVRSQ